MPYETRQKVLNPSVLLVYINLRKFVKAILIVEIDVLPTCFFYTLSFARLQRTPATKMAAKSQSRTAISKS